MTSTILEKIIARKRIRVEEAKRDTALSHLVARAQAAMAFRRNFRAAISQPDRINIIAEFKRASPSKGVINDSRDPAVTARLYKNGGAAAISVLTEEDFFQGSLDDLRSVRNAVESPILRKDFIIDEFQIYESAAAGADAILLIVAAQRSENLRRFQKLAYDVGLDAVVEVHDLDELKTAIAIEAKIIGVNNRDLCTFEVSLDVSRDLITHAPTDAIMVSESGLNTRNDLVELRDLGYCAFLIGETLMRSNSPGNELKKMATERAEELSV